MYVCYISHVYYVMNILCHVGMYVYYMPCILYAMQCVYVCVSPPALPAPLCLSLSCRMMCVCACN